MLPFLLKPDAQTTELLTDLCMLHGFCSRLKEMLRQLRYQQA